MLRTLKPKQHESCQEDRSKCIYTKKVKQLLSENKVNYPWQREEKERKVNLFQ